MKFPVRSAIAAALLGGLAIAMPDESRRAAAQETRAVACAGTPDTHAAGTMPLCSDHNSSRTLQKFAER